MSGWPLCCCSLPSQSLHRPSLVASRSLKTPRFLSSLLARSPQTIYRFGRPPRVFALKAADGRREGEMGPLCSSIFQSQKGLLRPLHVRLGWQRGVERRGERVYLGQIRLLNGWDAFFFFHAFAAFAISLRGGASIERKNEWQSGEEEKGKGT